MVSDFLSTEKNNDIYSVCLIRRRVNIFIDTPMSSVLTFVNRTTRSVSIRCPSPSLIITPVFLSTTEGAPILTSITRGGVIEGEYTSH